MMVTRRQELSEEVARSPVGRKGVRRTELEFYVRILLRLSMDIITN